MDDTELYRERILRHAGPVITGRFLGFRTSYTREVKVAQPLLLAVFITATIAQAISALILSLLRSGGGGARLAGFFCGGDMGFLAVRGWSGGRVNRA